VEPTLPVLRNLIAGSDVDPADPHASVARRSAHRRGERARAVSPAADAATRAAQRGIGRFGEYTWVEHVMSVVS
jgi:hypothetical protein